MLNVAIIFGLIYRVRRLVVPQDSANYTHRIMPSTLTSTYEAPTTHQKSHIAIECSHRLTHPSFINSSLPIAEWTQTSSSCVAHGTKAAFVVPGGFRSIQSLPVRRNSLDIFYQLLTAGERVKQLDCQGEKGRSWTNSQIENKINKFQYPVCDVIPHR